MYEPEIINLNFAKEKTRMHIRCKGGVPKPTPPPEPIPPPSPVRETSRDVQEAGQTEAEREKRRTGRKKTILSGAQGLSDNNANTQQTKLLGG